jgi:hypothetical protein
VSATTTKDVTALLRGALDASVTPAKDPWYGELVAEYLARPTFMAEVVEAASGFGLTVLHCDQTSGLMVAAQPGTPYAPTWGWLREKLKAQPTADNRLIFGVLLAAVAAFAFPTRESMHDRALKRLTARDVDALVRRHITLLEADEAVLEDDLVPAWKAYAARKSVALTQTGRLRSECTVKMAEQLLDLLADQRLLLRTEEDDTVVYRTTDRFREHVARHGAALAYRAIIDSPANPSLPQGSTLAAVPDIPERANESDLPGEVR